MGLRLVLRAFKGPSVEGFREVFADQVERYGGQVAWGELNTLPKEDMRIAHHADVHTVYLPYLSGADYWICHLVGAALNVPWIEARIQEGTFWDYSLFNGHMSVDQFTTLPAYWGQDADQYGGDPDLLARLWQIPKQRIERYLRHWGAEPIDEFVFRSAVNGKAYDSDQHEYGEIYQLFDFLTALGASDPMVHGTCHRLVIPPIESLRKAAALLHD